MYSKDTGKDQMLMTMERALTSGQKAGFFFLGFLGGIVGILPAAPIRSCEMRRGILRGCPFFSALL